MAKLIPNNSQQEAIDTIHGSLLISAGPGTGKTATLVNRYANMVLNHGISPENIMISTFTEKASKELITRISSQIPDLNLNEMYIGTFHSICLRIVRDNIGFIPELKKGFTLMDDFDQKYFIYQNFHYGFGGLSSFRSLPLGNRGIWEKSSLLSTLFNDMTEKLIRTEELLASTDNQLIALGEAKVHYDRLLQSHNRLDFATIQAIAYQLFFNNIDIRKKYQELFQYMMIDEYQDTNSIQEKLVFMLSSSNNICVVGDDDQSMYRFRGATVKNILEFKEKFPEGSCKEVKLTINYRSAPEIIDFYNKWMNDYANDFFAWGKYRIEKEIIPCKDKTVKKSTPPVLKIQGDTVTSWSENIYSFLQKMHSDGYISNYNQVAFLFRSVSNDKAKSLAHFLEDKGIPVYSPRSKMYFEREEVKAAIGILLSLFSDFEESLLEDDSSWFEDMVSYYDSCLSIAYDLMDEDVHLEEWISYRRNELGSLKGATDFAFTQLLYQMFSFEYFSNILDTDLSSGVADQRAVRNLATLTNIFAKFESVEKVEVISSDRKVNILKKLFRTFLRFMLKGGIEEYQDESEYAPSGCVSFMTIHQSKGMEFPVVITDSLYDSPRSDSNTLISQISNKDPNINTYEPEDAIKYFDFWRRYYVAFSRAEELLLLTTPVKSSGHSQSPSRFFASAWNDIDDYNAKDWSFEEFNFSQVKNTDLRQSYAFTTDISKYERCSIEYKMFRELGFSEIRVGSTLFGSLVHHTIEDVHNAILRNEVETIESNISDWFEDNYQGLILSEHSYLAPSAKAAALRYVKNYFNNSQDMWANIREAEVKLSCPVGDFILNGEVDMLRGEGDTVEIVDFKTGDKPSSITDEMLVSYQKQLQVYAHLVEQKYGVEVSKMKLYYLSAENNPIISFDKDSGKIDNMVKEFAEIVDKIESHNYSTRTSNSSICKDCDMRYYCNKSNPKR